MVAIDFGNKLKQLRTEAGLTQKQLAEQIGVTKSVISFYELRERTPSPDVLIRLASVFHVSADFLLGIEKNEEIDTDGLTAEDITAVKSLVSYLREKNRTQT